MGNHLETYLEEAAELHARGGFTDELDYTNFLSAVHEVVGDIEGMYERFGNEVMQRLLSLDEDFEACRREGHVWSRFTRTDGMPRGMYGAYALERKCSECGCTHTRAFTRAGKPNGNRRFYETGYLVHGVTKTTRIYQSHMWVLVAKNNLDREMTTFRRRAGQASRHLNIA